MVLALERGGLITRKPGTARSIRLLVDPEILPTLKAAQDQTISPLCSATRLSSLGARRRV